MKFLGEDNLYWALVFCFTVYNKENYLNIKRALDKIKLDILVDYHEILQKNLDKPNTDMDFITLIQSTDTIRATTLSCSQREAKRQVDEVLKLNTKEEQDQAFSKLQSELCNSDSLIIKNIIKQIEIVAKKDEIINSELKEIYNLEMKKISEYMLRITYNIYNRCRMREEYNKNLEINCHKSDSQRRQYHQGRGNLHREGKSLVKRK